LHKVSGVLNPICERGAYVWFLPKYSPDLNPIEFMWSKVKSVLRKLKARTFEELQKAKIAFSEITLSDIKNWYKHDGHKTMSI